MSTGRTLCAIAFASISAVAVSQSVTFPAGAHSAVVPAKVIARYFFVEGQINGKPATFIVDSGAAMNVLSPEAATKFGISGGVKVPAVGAGEKATEARIVKIDRFDVGPLALTDEQAVVVPLPPALRCDGLVGYGFLKRFATTFDYAAGKLTFSDPATFKAPANALALELRVDAGIPTVPGTLEGADGWFSLDTGANGTLTVMSPFVEENKLRDKLPKGTTRIAGKGVGGLVMGEQVDLASVTFGNLRLPTMPAYLSAARAGALAKKNLIGNAGAQIFERFRMTLDYANHKAYFEPADRFNGPFERDRSGLAMDFDGTRHVVIGMIDGPAKDSGVQVGDEVVAIDGKALAEVHPLEASNALRQQAGTVVTLKIRRGSALKELKLTLRDL